MTFFKTRLLVQFLGNEARCVDMKSVVLWVGFGVGVMLCSVVLCGMVWCNMVLHCVVFCCAMCWVV